MQISIQTLKNLIDEVRARIRHRINPKLHFYTGKVLESWTASGFLVPVAYQYNCMFCEHEYWD